MALLRDTKARAKRIDLTYFKRSHPFRSWKRNLSILATLGAVGWIGAAAAVKDDRLYTSGRLAMRHAMLEEQCAACHKSSWGERYLDPKGWQAKLDAACLACHDAPVHHANATHQVAGERATNCSSCHVEHESSTRLAAVRDVQCVACHGDLKTTAKAAHPAGCLAGPEHAIAPSIRSFEEGHPEFAILAKGVKDPTALQFNHGVHLRPDSPLKKETIQGQFETIVAKLKTSPALAGIEGAKGERTFACSYCHKASDGARMDPILYETHCMDCHELKLEKDVVPHETPKALRDFLRSRLAGQEKKEDDLAVEVAQAETDLYTSGTGCAKCHKVEEGSPEELPKVARTGARTGPPNDEGRPRSWMTHAFFSHDTHRTLRCLECHPGADTSKLTSDVLMPKKAACATCHGTIGGVASTCVTCHVYHDKSKIRPESGRIGIKDVVK